MVVNLIQGSDPLSFVNARSYVCKNRQMASWRESSSCLVEGKKFTAKFCCCDFTAHAHPMKYDEYLAAERPIATSVIEEACRHLVKDRLERSGMCWSAEGALAMLSLRSLKASNAWDEFHKHFLNPLPSMPEVRKCGHAHNHRITDTFEAIGNRRTKVFVPGRTTWTYDAASNLTKCTGQKGRGDQRKRPAPWYVVRMS